MKFPIKVVLKNKDGKSFGSGEITRSNRTCSFKGLPEGVYHAVGTFADGGKIKSKENRLCECLEITYFLSEDFLLESKKDTPSKPKPPLKAILASAFSMTLLSNFGGLTPLIEAIKSSLLNSSRVQSTQASSLEIQTNYTASREKLDNIFSVNVEAKLRQCIETNFINISGIPTMKKLLSSLSWEIEPTGEFEYQLISNYRKVKQLQLLIEKCDSTLLWELAAAEKKVATSTGEVVIVIGEVVNIRSGPSLGNNILEEVRYGTILEGVRHSLAR